MESLITRGTSGGQILQTILEAFFGTFFSTFFWTIFCIFLLNYFFLHFSHHHHPPPTPAPLHFWVYDYLSVESPKGKSGINSGKSAVVVTKMYPRVVQRILRFTLC